MKLSQAVGLYIQRKRDAGMRFDSPRQRVRSFLRHCGDDPVATSSASNGIRRPPARWTPWESRVSRNQ